jgi:hypothetical protein
MGCCEHKSVGYVGSHCPKSCNCGGLQHHVWKMASSEKRIFWRSLSSAVCSSPLWR